MKEDIKNFFKVSNAIEGIIDENETLACADIFKKIRCWDYEKAMYHFHSKINYLNDYCVSGRLRNYDVFVGGKKCLDSKNIPETLKELFLRQTNTLKKIKQWHIDFEKCHPFGDGNGRVGRFLMLMQVEKNNVKLPKMFFTMDNVDNFEKNRQKYYRWFK